MHTIVKIAVFFSLLSLPLMGQTSVPVAEDFSIAVNANIAGVDSGYGWGGPWQCSVRGDKPDAAVAPADLSAAAPKGYDHEIVPNALHLKSTGKSTVWARRPMGHSIDTTKDGTYYFTAAFARADSNNGNGNEFVEFSFGGKETPVVSFGFDSSEKLAITFPEKRDFDVISPSPVYFLAKSLPSAPKRLIAGKIVCKAGAAPAVYFSMIEPSSLLNGEPEWTLVQENSPISGKLSTLHLRAGRYAENVYFDTIRMGNSWESVSKRPTLAPNG